LIYNPRFLRGSLTMNARQLEVFRAIMRNGTLTAAAQALRVSQPAVGKVLRHFESQIGYPLFKLLGGRLVATPEAHLLFRDADRIFREIEALKSFSERIRDKRLGFLRIGASGPPTFVLLPLAAERFRRRNPGVELEIQTLPAEEIGERIVVGEIDLGVTMATIGMPQLHNQVLGSAQIVAVMSKSSALGRKAEIWAADLVGETLISYGSKPAIGRLLDQAFREAGLTRKAQIEVTLSIAAMPLVQRGLGVALVDGLVPWAGFRDLVVRPFRPVVSQDIVLVTNSTLPGSRFGREFGRDLQAAIASLGKKTQPTTRPRSEGRAPAR
jgi:DNA-binding transcriptional LysR family regulator